MYPKIFKAVSNQLPFSTIEGVGAMRLISTESISGLLSVGVLGLKKNKRLVPTRWSITATDDMLGKHLWKQVQQHKWIEDYELHW